MTDEIGEITELCPTCGAGPSFQNYLWKSPDGAEQGKYPDCIGCDECLTLRAVDVDAAQEGRR